VGETCFNKLQKAPLLDRLTTGLTFAYEMDKGSLRNLSCLQPFPDNLLDLRKGIFPPDKGTIKLVEIAVYHYDPSLEGLIDSLDG